LKGNHLIMSNHKIAKRALKAGGSLSLAVTIAFSGAAMSFAADAPALTPAEQATMQAEYDASTQGKMSGEVISIDISDADEAMLNADGIDIDEVKSAVSTNVFNASNDTYPQALLEASFDEAAFTANSEIGSKVANPRLDIVIGDNNFTASNITPKDAAPVPNLPKGKLFNPWVGLRATEGESLPGAFTLAGIMPGTSWSNGGVADDLNGKADSEKSVYTQTWISDRFAQTPQRQADTSLGGTQRNALSSGLLNCTAVEATCGVWATAVVAGDFTIDADGNTQEATTAISDPFFIKVKTTVAAQTPTHTEANPFVSESGAKVYFKPVNEGAEPVITETNSAGVSTQKYNVLNPSVALKPWKYVGDVNLEAGWNNPEITDAYATDNADGTSRINFALGSSFAGSEFVGTVTDGANASTKTVTIANDHAELGDNWQYQGKVLVAGNKIVVGTAGEATVVSASKGELVLSFVSTAPDATFAFKSATVGSQVGFVGHGTHEWLLPAYEMVVIPGAPVPTETPTPTPTPEVPVPSETPVPEETPTPTETPVVIPDDSTTNEVVIPDDAGTSEMAADDLANTGAQGNLILWMLAGVSLIVTGGLAIARSFKGRFATKH
jgi:hypothetical protein